MNTNISVCGSDCSKCYCAQANMCIGCNECRGKVFHCPDNQECAIYHCCVTRHSYLNCLDCKQIPCEIWMKTRDPKFSDEEFKQNIADRIAMLHKKVCL